MNPSVFIYSYNTFMDAFFFQHFLPNKLISSVLPYIIVNFMVRDKSKGRLAPMHICESP